jgi:hypothetical protein
MVSQLVACGVADTAVEEAAAGLPKAPADVLKAFARRLDALPPVPSPADVVRGEGKEFHRLLRNMEKRAVADPFATGAPLALGDVGGGPVPPNIVEVRAQWSDPKRRAAAIAEVAALTDDTAAAVAVPLDQFPAAAAAVDRKWKAASPLAQVVQTPVDRFRYRVAQADARLAMLRAAIQVRLIGPDALKTIKDPYGTGPFESRVVQGGIELKSKLVVKDKPVTLVTGPASRDQ